MLKNQSGGKKSNGIGNKAHGLVKNGSGDEEEGSLSRDKVNRFNRENRKISGSPPGSELFIPALSHTFR